MTDQAPHDWCPECDGPGQCQPGLCCGRPYPSLADAEVLARHHAALNPWLVSLLAEYDARGERIAELERERAEATKAVADCGVCKIGGRWLHIDDDCPKHGDEDW